LIPINIAELILCQLMSFRCQSTSGGGNDFDMLFDGAAEAALKPLKAGIAKIFVTLSEYRR